MKSKLAIGSWILPIVGYGLYILSAFIMKNFIPGRNIGLDLFLIFVLVLGSTISGLIFGIIGLVKISHNSQLTGKGHSIFGIILSFVLFLYGGPMLFAATLVDFMGG